MIKLVPITDVKASEYNPRKNDEKRLALTEMSLRKLGFLLPIYADTSGEILSGHQRHLVATRMGFTKPKWKFDADVAHCFANMLERSIPDYRSMRSLVYELGERFIKPQTVITDIGCSTGLAVEPFFNKHGDNNAYFLCDNSEAMIEVCKDKFSVGISGGYVELVNGNFYEKQIPDNQSLVLSILSMQFMPTAYRQNMINSIYEALNPGGAFVFVEKIIADEGTDDLNVDLYYQMKRENGYTEEKIMQKRKSLENVLSPLKAEWNEDMLHEAGFEKVDMFWRCLNFCGWVAIK